MYILNVSNEVQNVSTQSKKVHKPNKVECGFSNYRYLGSEETNKGRFVDVWV
jgi:hypothetical protein